MIETPSYVRDGVDRLDKMISHHIYRDYRTWNYLATSNTGFIHELPGAPFDMRAYNWGDCIAPVDTGTLDWEYCTNEKCYACKPNFSFPAANLELRWYKHSNRGRECNREISYEEWRKIERECEDWILAQQPKDPYEEDK